MKQVSNNSPVIKILSSFDSPNIISNPVQNSERAAVILVVMRVLSNALVVCRQDDASQVNGLDEEIAESVAVARTSRTDGVGFHGGDA